MVTLNRRFGFVGFVSMLVACGAPAPNMTEDSSALSTQVRDSASGDSRMLVTAQDSGMLEQDSEPAVDVVDGGSVDVTVNDPDAVDVVVPVDVAVVDSDSALPTPDVNTVTDTAVIADVVTTCPERNDILCNNGCYNAFANDTNCGTCGNTCRVQHASARPTYPGNPPAPYFCYRGICDYNVCDSGWSDCDNMRGNGCECGGFTNAVGSCQATTRACVPVCNNGFGNCDNNNVNGCETTLDTVENCGACGNRCVAGPNQVLMGCSAGQCVFGCTAGFYNCDRNVTNGCETNVTNDGMNCGTCGGLCLSGICRNSTCTR